MGAARQTTGNMRNKIFTNDRNWEMVLSPQISAVIPCFNGEKFLERCLNSVLDQEYNVHEIILVDDGSLDNSVQVAKSWQNKNDFNKLHIYEQSNKGVSVARNFGIKKAGCEWISFLDVDDIWYKNHNLDLIKLLNKYNNQAIAAFSDADRVMMDDNHEIPSFFEMTFGRCSFSKIITNKNESFEYDKLIRSSFLPTSSNIIRKSALEIIGGFQIGRKYGEDRQAWLKLFTIGSVAISTEKMSAQFYHGSNATHPRNRIKERKANVELFDEFIKNRNQYEFTDRHINMIYEMRSKALRGYKYAISESGIKNMIFQKKELEFMGDDFTVKDWCRGIAREFL